REECARQHELRPQFPRSGLQAPSVAISPLRKFFATQSQHFVSREAVTFCRQQLIKEPLGPHTSRLCCSRRVGCFCLRSGVALARQLFFGVSAEHEHRLIPNRIRRSDEDRRPERALASRRSSLRRCEGSAFAFLRQLQQKNCAKIPPEILPLTD